MLWADSKFCDSTRVNNFYEIQQVACLSWLMNGDACALVEYERPTPAFPYGLRVHLIEADRVSTPHTSGTAVNLYATESTTGNRIFNGVEVTDAGRVVAYHICSTYPNSQLRAAKKWQRVKAFGDKTGTPNVLMIFEAERAEQYRGVPFLAPVITTIKQITRYTEAEIMAAVINSMFAIFVSSDEEEPVEGFSGEDDEDWHLPGQEDSEDEIKLGSGIINFLKKGEKVEAVETKHPAGNYDAFVQAMANMIGAALEIAPEILMKKFTKNFSASKGALNETWRSFKMRRKWFVDDFCQQVYELWFAEAVSKGRIQAPGFFTDPLIRKSYTNATWNGPAQGCLEPTKEVAAAVTRIENGLSTREDECAAINGSDFEDNIRTLANENARLVDAKKIFNEEEGPVKDGEED